MREESALSYLVALSLTFIVIFKKIVQALNEMHNKSYISGKTLSELQEYVRLLDDQIKKLQDVIKS